MSRKPGGSYTAHVVLELVTRSQAVLMVLMVSFYRVQERVPGISTSSNVVHGFTLLMFILHSFPLDVTNCSVLLLSNFTIL